MTGLTSGTTPVVPHPNASSSAQIEGLAALTHGNGERRKAHVRRKHRANCPKHLLHQKEAGQEIDPPKEAKVPHGIGKGLAMFLTGTFDKQEWKRRPNVEHPDFRLCSKPADVMPESKNIYNAAHGDLTRSNPLGHYTATRGNVKDEPLLADPLDQKHCRRKHELKSYMESMYQMGTALLRKL